MGLPTGYNKELAHLLLDFTSFAYKWHESDPNQAHPRPAGWEYEDEFFGLTVWSVRLNMKYWTILSSSQSVVVAFRGAYRREIFYPGCDIRLSTPDFLPKGSGRVHRGFLTAYYSCRQELREKLQDVNIQAQGKRLYLSGYSLGGVLATLCALDLNQNSPDIPKVSALYTFGSPRVGTAAFARYFDREIGQISYRVARPKDFATKLPPPWVAPIRSYSHVGQFVPLEGSTSDDGFSRHGIKTYLALFDQAKL